MLRAILRFGVVGQLCEEVRLNLAYRWFCRLGLEDKLVRRHVLIKFEGIKQSLLVAAVFSHHAAALPTSTRWVVRP